MGLYCLYRFYAIFFTKKLIFKLHLNLFFIILFNLKNNILGLHDNTFLSKRFLKYAKRIAVKGSFNMNGTITLMKYEIYGFY